jgi:hypothetical protein
MVITAVEEIKNPIVQLFNVTDNEDANGCQIRLVRIDPFA